MRLQSIISEALSEANVLNPLSSDKDDKKKEPSFKTDFKEETDSGAAGAYDTPNAFRKKMKDSDDDSIDLEELVASLNDELEETDAISWKKMSGTSLDPAPQKVGKSIDDEEILIDEEESAEKEVEHDEEEKELKSATTVVEDCDCGSKKSIKEDVTAAGTADYTEALYADEIADLEKETEEEAETEELMAMLYLNLMDLLGEDMDQFITSIDYVAPAPPTFRINLANGYDEFYMTLSDRSAIATISGKKYYLRNLEEEERAAQALARVLAYNKGSLENERE